MLTSYNVTVVMVRVIVIVASIGEIIVHTKACNKKYHHTPTEVALLIFYSDAGGAELDAECPVPRNQIFVRSLMCSHCTS